MSRSVNDGDAASSPSSSSVSPGASLRDRWLAWRDRLLASPRFQHAAARFLPTRWIARRRARALFDLVAGFTYSQTLLACVRLGWFDLLLERPRSVAELATQAALDEDAAERLIAAAVALRLLERRGGARGKGRSDESDDMRSDVRGDLRYGLGPLGAPMAGNAAIASMVEHHALLYADLADPLALLRRRSTTALGTVWGYAASDDARSLDPARVAAYSSLMTHSQPLVADQILDAYSLKRHRRLLDVGGGEGAFAVAAAARHPHLFVEVFDLPAVAERARERFAAAGIAERASACGGDFARDPLPLGADVATLVRVIHDHDDERAMDVLRAVHAALPDDGVLLLAEPMAATAGAEPMGDAYFGLYLFAMGSGRPRSADRLRDMLARAGFRAVRLLPTALPIQARVLLARK